MLAKMDPLEILSFYETFLVVFIHCVMYIILLIGVSAPIQRSTITCSPTSCTRSPTSQWLVPFS